MRKWREQKKRHLARLASMQSPAQGQFYIEFFLQMSAALMLVQLPED